MLAVLETVDEREGAETDELQQRLDNLATYFKDAC